MVDSKESYKFDLGVKELRKPLDKNIKTSPICIAYQCIHIKKSKFLLWERVLIVVVRRWPWTKRFTTFIVCPPSFCWIQPKYNLIGPIGRSKYPLCDKAEKPWERVLIVVVRRWPWTKRFTTFIVCPPSFCWIQPKYNLIGPIGRSKYPLCDKAKKPFNWCLGWKSSQKWESQLFGRNKVNFN